MTLPRAVWLGIVFFLCGVLVASLFEERSAPLIEIFLLTGWVAGALCLFRRGKEAAFSFFLFVGALYAIGFARFAAPDRFPLGAEGEFLGRLEDIVWSGTSARLRVELLPPYDGTVQVQGSARPAWRVGDILRIRGSVEAPREAEKAYFRKEGIYGVMRFARITRDEEGEWSVRRPLVELREWIQGNFSRVLPKEEASFLSGVTLGARSEFSESLRENISKTGTNHLVALSGYNVAVLAGSVLSLLAIFRSPGVRVPLGMIAVIAFVIMTGAQASVVRAAIMVGIALFGTELARPYSVRQAVALAAFAMVLVNPAVLAFDLGFQLSFLAVLGIHYVRPALLAFCRARQKEGMLGWRDAAATTAAAQLAVLPLLFLRFGEISLVALPANILLVAVMPATMAMGFMITAAAALSPFLAEAAGAVTHLLLRYELGVIAWFAAFGSFAKISVSGFGFLSGALYYAGIAFFVWRMKAGRPLLFHSYA